MDETYGSNSPEFEIGLMTEQELYELHLRALGLPRKRYGQLVDGFCHSPLKRALTILDAFLLLVWACASRDPAVIIPCLTMIVLSICNVTAGPFSLCPLFVCFCCDLVPAPLPSPAALRVGSPESLSLVADFLISPKLKSALSFIAKCESELIPIERSLAEAIEIECLLHAEKDREKESPLAILLDREISNAEEITCALRARRDEMQERAQVAREEIGVLRASLQQLRVLSVASSQLRIIRERALPRTQEQDEEVAKNQVLELCTQMERARHKVHDMEELAIAQARAVIEVRALSRAS